MQSTGGAIFRSPYCHLGFVLAPISDGCVSSWAVTALSGCKARRDQLWELEPRCRADELAGGRLEVWRQDFDVSQPPRPDVANIMPTRAPIERSGKPLLAASFAVDDGALLGSLVRVMGR